MSSCMFISVARDDFWLGICPGGAGTRRGPVGREFIVLAAEPFPRLVELLVDRLALFGREGVAQVLPQGLEEFPPALHALARIERFEVGAQLLPVLLRLLEDGVDLGLLLVAELELADDFLGSVEDSIADGSPPAAVRAGAAGRLGAAQWLGDQQQE